MACFHDERHILGRQNRRDEVRLGSCESPFAQLVPSAAQSPWLSFTCTFRLGPLAQLGDRVQRRSGRAGRRRRARSGSACPSRSAPADASVLQVVAEYRRPGSRDYSGTLRRPGSERVLGLLVGDLEEVRDGERGERERDPAREPRGDEQTSGEGARDPQSDAVGADEQLADSTPQAAAAGGFLDSPGGRVVLVARDGAGRS